MTKFVLKRPIHAFYSEQWKYCSVDALLVNGKPVKITNLAPSNRIDILGILLDKQNNFNTGYNYLGMIDVIIVSSLEWVTSLKKYCASEDVEYTILTENN